MTGNEWCNSHCARNRARDYRGRFSGERYDLESLPRLPTFPARWVLADPRRRPYFVFWTRDGALFWFLFMWPVGQGEAVRVRSWSGDSYTLPIVRRPMPRRGGTAILYRCPWCQRPRRYLYPLAGVRPGVIGESHGPFCQACLGLRWASQGWYISPFARALMAADLRPGRRRAPRHREPWDPRAVSDPRMVMDEFPELAFKGAFPADVPGATASGVPERTNLDQTDNRPRARDREPTQGREDDGLEGYVPLPPLTDALTHEAIRRPQPPPRPVPPPRSWLSA